MPDSTLHNNLCYVYLKIFNRSERKYKNMESGTYYDQALRYIKKAEAELKKSGKDEDGKYYTTKKYVKSAGGIGYAGILEATKQYIVLNGIAINDDTDEKEIKVALAKLNPKAVEPFNHFYSYLYFSVHLYCNSNVAMLSEVFKEAKEFIALLKQ
jgi:hypothetical protein